MEELSLKAKEAHRVFICKELWQSGELFQLRGANPKFLPILQRLYQEG